MSLEFVRHEPIGTCDDLSGTCSVATPQVRSGSTVDGSTSSKTRTARTAEADSAIPRADSGSATSSE